MNNIPNHAFVLVPTPITDAMLTSCSVPEPAPEETAWDATAGYAVGQIAVRSTTHRRYQRLVAGTSATPPELDMSDPPNWLALGATNRWAQFDNKMGTRTRSAGGDLTVVLRPGSVEGLALLDLRGTRAEVTVRATPGGTVVYARSVELDASAIGSVYDWVFGDYVQKLNAVLTDLPGQFPSCEVTIVVRSTSSAEVGSTVLGRVHPLGATEYGAGAGIINWGKVNDDGFGNREWLQGEYASRVTLPIVANRSDMARLHRQLAAVRSTPCVYIGSGLDIYEPLVCYGVYRDLYITVPTFAFVQMNLEIDGLNNI